MEILGIPIWIIIGLAVLLGINIYTAYKDMPRSTYAKKMNPWKLGAVIIGIPILAVVILWFAKSGYHILDPYMSSWDLYWVPFFFFIAAAVWLYFRQNWKIKRWRADHDAWSVITIARPKGIRKGKGIQILSLDKKPLEDNPDGLFIGRSILYITEGRHTLEIIAYIKKSTGKGKPKKVMVRKEQTWDFPYGENFILDYNEKKKRFEIKGVV